MSSEDFDPPVGAMLCTEPGFRRITVFCNAERRSVWTRFSPEPPTDTLTRHEPETIEICVGREGDDGYVILRADTVLTPRHMHQIFVSLDYATSLIDEDESQKSITKLLAELKDTGSRLNTAETIANLTNIALEKLRPGHGHGCTSRYVHGDGTWCTCGREQKPDSLEAAMRLAFERDELARENVRLREKIATDFRKQDSP